MSWEPDLLWPASLLQASHWRASTCEVKPSVASAHSSQVSRSSSVGWLEDWSRLYEDEQDRRRQRPAGPPRPSATRGTWGRWKEWAHFLAKECSELYSKTR